MPGVSKCLTRADVIDTYTKMRTNITMVLLGVISVFGIPNQISAQDSFPSDQNGRSCLSEHHGRSVEQQTQPGAWEHYVRVTNRCDRAFQIKICYEGTRDCIQITAAPGRESIGTLGVKRFQHSKYDVGHVR